MVRGRQKLCGGLWVTDIKEDKNQWRSMKEQQLERQQDKDAERCVCGGLRLCGEYIRIPSRFHLFTSSSKTPPLFLPCSTKGGSLHAYTQKKEHHMALLVVSLSLECGVRYICYIWSWLFSLFVHVIHTNLSFYSFWRDRQFKLQTDLLQSALCKSFNVWL